MQALGKDVRDLLALLDKHAVRYLIVGGFAVAVHGTPRYTKDLDIWVECSSDNAGRLVRVLEDFGFSSLGVTALDFETPDLVVQLGYEPNRIDILTGLTGARFEDAYPQRITANIGDLEVPIIDRASLIANKRPWSSPRSRRRGGSRTMSDRAIGKIVRVATLSAVDKRAERRAYWANRSPEERFLEVESLRRMWVEITGDPDLPIQRVIQRRPLRQSS
jgi:hypothetical protein